MKDKIEEFSNNPEIVGLYDVEKAREQVNRINILAAEKRGMESGEKNKSLEIARNMLKDNMPIETIMKYTLLSKEEIEALQ